MKRERLPGASCGPWRPLYAFYSDERDTVGGSKAAEWHDVILFYQYDAGLVF